MRLGPDSSRSRLRRMWEPLSGQRLFVSTDTDIAAGTAAPTLKPALSWAWATDMKGRTGSPFRLTGRSVRFEQQTHPTQSAERSCKDAIPT
jgi:hypothetical protein